MKPNDEANEAIGKIHFKWIFVINDDLFCIWITHTERCCEASGMYTWVTLFSGWISLKWIENMNISIPVTPNKHLMSFYGVILTSVTYVRNFFRYLSYYSYYYYHYCQTITQFHCCGIKFIFRGISNSFWHIFH